MSSRAIAQIGNKNLRLKSAVVTDVSSVKVRRLIERLHKKLIKIGGVGLAAPQLGVSLQLFVVRIYPTKYRPEVKTVEPYTVINPVILHYSESQDVVYEGCFSVAEANLFAKVSRPEKVTVTYYNENGQIVNRTLHGLEARVFQHEYDHLNGMFFVDRDVDMKSAMSGHEYRMTQTTAKVLN
jgi:peptide deformylase